MAEDNQQKDNSNVDKSFNFKKWIWWQVAGIIVLLGIVAFYIVELERTYRHNVDNSIYALSNYNVTFQRGIETSMPTITSMGDAELHAKLPELEEIYKLSQGDEQKAQNGTTLALAYIRLHDREKAKTLLTDLISTYQFNPNFSADLNNWETILSLLK